MDVKYQVVFINRPEDTCRRENMIKRLSYHNIDEFVHIITADDNNDEFRASLSIMFCKAVTLC